VALGKTEEIVAMARKRSVYVSWVLSNKVLKPSAAIVVKNFLLVVCRRHIPSDKLGLYWDKHHQTKKDTQPKVAKCLKLLVPGPGIEPGTHGFSVRLLF